MDERATILVIDDEYGIRQSFDMVLKDQYHVLLVENGEEAIDIFTKRNVDLILLDILLPDIYGLDLLERLSKTIFNVRVRAFPATAIIPLPRH